MSKNGYETADGWNYELLKEHALDKRKNPTDAEDYLWQLLRGNQLGVKFRRQYIIDNFIGDFVCLSHRLILEIDGGYHNQEEQIISDEERSERLNSLGFYVLRFTNEQVMADTDYVIERIKYHLQTAPKFTYQ